MFPIFRSKLRRPTPLQQSHQPSTCVNEAIGTGLELKLGLTFQECQAGAQVHVEAGDLGQGQGGCVDHDGHVEASQEDEAH